MASRTVAIASSWPDLSTAIQFVVQEHGFNLHEAGRRGIRKACSTAPSAQSEVRLFGAEQRDMRVTLYRDNHAWCPYCHKVWMQLEEKQIPYRVEKVSMNCYGQKRRDFLEKTPRGLLPALEIDGRFMTESSRIMQKIEESFPESKPLMLRGTPDLLDLERQLFGTWLNWLRGEESSRARKMFESAMNATEQALKASGGPYFGGKDITLADCVFASSLERIAASILYYKGLRIRGNRWPYVEAWFREMESRDSYKASRSDYHTHCHDLPPQIGGCIASGSAEQRAAAAAIDGTDGSWNLPLPPLTVDSLEPGSEDPVLDKLEAANALVHCHEGVLRAAKGNEAADAAYRYVVQALIVGIDDLQKSEQTLGPSTLDASAAAALRYTRDRISVPRDMSFAAARQLRAHLNWAAEIIDPSKGWKGVPLPTGDRRDTDPRNFGASL